MPQAGKKKSSSHRNDKVRLDQTGTHRGAFEKNKKKILATQTVCGICGMPVDKKLKYPHPMSPCIDHIIPIARGGHPSDIDNLQLAHWSCNRQKSDKILRTNVDNSGKNKFVDEVINNRNLPLSCDWKKYRAPSTRAKKNVEKSEGDSAKEEPIVEKNIKKRQRIMF